MFDFFRILAAYYAGSAVAYFCSKRTEVGLIFTCLSVMFFVVAIAIAK